MTLFACISNMIKYEHDFNRWMSHRLCVVAHPPPLFLLYPAILFHYHFFKAFIAPPYLLSFPTSNYIKHSLSQVQQLAPENPSLAIELNRLKTAKAAYHAREKQMAKNMASKLFPDLKKADKAVVKNQVENNNKETFDKTDPKVLNETCVGKEKEKEEKMKKEKEKERDREGGDLKADGGPITSKEIETAPSTVPVPVAVPASKDKDKDILKGESEGSRDRVATGTETETGTADTGVATPSALLMIVCSTAVLVLSLLIALYLK